MAYAKYGDLIGRKSQLYRFWKIPKRSGGWRKITAPKDELRDAQREILKHYLYCFEPSKYSMAYMVKTGIAKNAAKHRGAKCIVKIDIRDFFPSIKKDMVIQTLKNLEFKDTWAQEIAEVCTYLDELPQGAPTSPALSNLVCVKLDIMLASRAEKFGKKYKGKIWFTRYADDIVFSTRNEGTAQYLHKIIPPAISIIEMCKFKLTGECKEDCRKICYKKKRQSAFKVNRKKNFIIRSGKRMKVTGLVVNEKVNIQRDKIRNFRAQLHNIKKGLQSNHYAGIDIQVIRKIKGYASFVYSINREKGEKFFSEIREIETLLGTKNG